MNDAMKVDAAIKYLAGRGVNVNRRTVYNWFKVGIRGVKLEHGTVPNTQPTAKDREVAVVTTDQLESFLASAGVG